jgi:hypothetical protein
MPPWRPPANGPEQQVVERRHTASEHDHLWVQRGDHVGDADAEPCGDSGDGLAHRGVAGPSRRAHLFRRDGGGVSGDHLEEGRRQAGEHQPDTFADQRRPTGESLQTAPVAAAAEWAVALDGLMAEFAGCSQGAEAEPTVHDNAAANAGPDGEKDHGVDAFAVAEGELPKGRHARVVEQKHRVAECRGESLANRDAAPLRGKIRQEAGDAGGDLRQPGHTHPDADRLRAETRREIGHQPGNPGQDAGGSFMGVGGDAAFGQNLAVGAGDSRRDLSASKVHAGE